MKNYMNRFNRKTAIAYVIALVIMLLLNQLAEAARPPHKKALSGQTRLIHTNAHRVCFLLFKKRTAQQKSSIRLATNRTRYKPMAETEPPQRIQRSN